MVSEELGFVTEFDASAHGLRQEMGAAQDYRWADSLPIHVIPKLTGSGHVGRQQRHARDSVLCAFANNKALF